MAALRSHGVKYRRPRREHHDPAAGLFSATGSKLVRKPAERLVAESEDPLRHLAEALRLRCIPEPGAAAALPAHLTAAAEALVSQGSGLLARRIEVGQAFIDVAESLRPLNAEIVARMPWHVKFVAGHVNVALRPGWLDLLTFN